MGLGVDTHPIVYPTVVDIDVTSVVTIIQRCTYIALLLQLYYILYCRYALCLFTYP